MYLCIFAKHGMIHIYFDKYINYENIITNEFLYLIFRILFPNTLIEKVYFVFFNNLICKLTIRLN